MPNAAPPIESVGFLLIPGFALMSYAAAVEPLRAANQLAGKTLYRWWHAAPPDQPAVASNGVAIVPDFLIGGEARKPDLILVCAGGNPAAFHDRRTLAWLRRLASRGVIMGGISGGPVILAKAGLLDRRRCTVHWEHVAALQEAFPNIRFTRSLYELDDDRFTCSGGVAGLDMMAAIITRDHGYQLGAAVSDWFLHTHMREASKPQRMDLRFRFDVVDENLLIVLRAMEAHIERPLSRRECAKLAGLSLRQLERLFRSRLGSGMHQHYLMLRLGRARQLLRETSLSILDVSIAAGFSSASQFSRAYKRAFGFTPREGRQQEQRHNRCHHRT